MRNLLWRIAVGLVLTASVGVAGERVGFVDVNLHLFGAAAPGIGRGGGSRQKPTNRKPGEKPGTTREGFFSAGKKLLALMDRYRIRCAVLVPPPRSSRNLDPVEVPALAELVKKYPDRFVLAAGGNELNPLIHATPRDAVTDKIKARFRSKAEALVKMGIRCFGEIAALHVSFTRAHVFEETLPDHPLFLLLADIAAEKGIPIDLHMQAVPRAMDTPAGLRRVSPNNPPRLKANIAALERLLKHNRKANILWRHLGWDNTGGRSAARMRRLLTDHPNLYMAIRIEERERNMSGGAMPNRIVDRQWRVTEEWLELFKAFPDRFMIGSDEFIPVEGDSTRMPQSFEETWKIIPQLPRDLVRSIGWENAERLYKIK